MLLLHITNIIDNVNDELIISNYFQLINKYNIKCYIVIIILSNKNIIEPIKIINNCIFLFKKTLSYNDHLLYNNNDNECIDYNDEFLIIKNIFNFKLFDYDNIIDNSV